MVGDKDRGRTQVSLPADSIFAGGRAAPSAGDVVEGGAGDRKQA